MSENQFKDLKVSLKVDFDPVTSLSQEMIIKDFQELNFDKNNDQLFKLAAK